MSRQLGDRFQRHSNWCMFDWHLKYFQSRFDNNRWRNKLLVTHSMNSSRQLIAYFAQKAVKSHWDEIWWFLASIGFVLFKTPSPHGLMNVNKFATDVRHSVRWADPNSLEKLKLIFDSEWLIFTSSGRRSENVAVSCEKNHFKRNSRICNSDLCDVMLTALN